MLLKRESPQFDSFFYSTIGNLPKEMSLLMSSFFICKTICLGYIHYLIIYPKTQATIINPILNMHLINDNLNVIHIFGSESLIKHYGFIHPTVIVISVSMIRKSYLSKTGKCYFFTTTKKKKNGLESVVILLREKFHSPTS